MTFIGKKLENERSRWVLWWPVAMGTGIFLYFSRDIEPSLTVSGVIVFLSTLLLLKIQESFWTPFIFFTSLGFFCATLRTQQIHPWMLEKSTEKTFVAVLNVIEKKPEKTRFILTPLNTPDIYKRVRLTLKNSDDFFLPGQKVKVVARLWPIPEPINPLVYDFRRTAFFEDIGAIGNILHIQHIETFSKPSIEKWRHILTEKLMLSMDPPFGSIASSLITGDRSGIPQELRQAYGDAGIAHILAISGLHLSLVAGIVFLTIRRSLSLIPYIAERYPIKKWAAAFAILFTGLYLLISGSAVPAKRAFIMVSLILTGVLMDRRVSPMRSLALAALMILIIWPESLLTASFQLSFSAVIALIAAYEVWEYQIKSHLWWRIPFSYVWGIIFSTVIATLATTPFIIALFNRFTLQALLGNLLAIPLTAFWIMPISLLCVFSLFFGGSTLLFKLWEQGIHLLNDTAFYVASLPGAAILIPTPPWPFIALVTFGGLWLCLWQKAWRFWGVIPIFLAGLILLISKRPDIFISPDGQILGFRKDITLYVSTSHTYYSDTWQRQGGLQQALPWDSPFISLHQTALVDQKRISSKELYKLCQMYRLVISNGYLPHFCHQITQVIDLRKTRLQGGSVIWNTFPELKLISTQAQKLCRPWHRRRMQHETLNIP